MLRDSTRIKPFKARPTMQLLDVVKLQQHSRRESRIGLIIGDLECEAPCPAKVIALQCDRAVIQEQPEHLQLTDGKPLQCDRTEIGAVGIVDRKRGIGPSLPTACFEVPELIDPVPDIAVRLQDARF
jgi:hypothetical protein